MILQALSGYYNRLFEGGSVPSFGFSFEKIGFSFVLTAAGKLVQVLDLRDIDGRYVRYKMLQIPHTNEVNVRSSNVQPNFLVDKAMYILGMDKKTKPKRLKDAHNQYKKLFNEVTKGVKDEGIEAIRTFLETSKSENALLLDKWDDLAKDNSSLIVFQLDGENAFIHDRPIIRDAWTTYLANKSTDDEAAQWASCLVTGKKAKIQRLHAQFKGIKGGQSSGKSLVSFNKDKTAFTSYGKEYSYNAPVSIEAEFRSSTALKYLLRFESRQKVQIGDAATVFWTERESPVEGFMGLILNPQDDSGDLKEVRDFLEAVRDGKKLPEEINDTDMKFYILGLSPNASRLSVRFWHVSTVGDISAKIGQHFKDLSIVKNYDSDPEFPGMWQLLRETAVLRKSENISPVLSGSIIRSIMTGALYPQSLMTATIGRIRADQEISYLRAAVIKACLVRKYRINQISKEVTMALDKESTNVAYRLGRLFAVLEKAQRDAIPGANTTIKDRYYGSASATPSIVFPQLLRLSQHHIQKADYGYAADRMIEEIMQDIQRFPTHLNLDDQGLFAIGYYHQRKNFFTKSDKKEDNNE